MQDMLDNFSSCEWILLASALSITLSQGLNSDEIGTLASFFSALGDNLGILANGKNNFT